MLKGLNKKIPKKSQKKSQKNQIPNFPLTQKKKKKKYLMSKNTHLTGFSSNFGCWFITTPALLASNYCNCSSCT